MTVPANKNKIIHAGDGSTATFNFDFPLLQDSDMIMQVESAAGVITTLTTDKYTLTYVAGDTAGGSATITDSGSIPAVGECLIQLRVASLLQTSDYKNTREIPANTLERDLDRRAMVEQQLDEENNRTLKLSVTSSGITTTLPSPTADTFLGWDSAGTAIENKTATDISSDIDITLSAADADKIVGVNSAGTGYETKTPNDYTDATIATGDEVIYSDADDSSNIKKDTVQGILDLIPAYMLSFTPATVATGDYAIFSDTDDSSTFKVTTIQGILDLVPSLNVKVGSFTRDMTAASGTDDETGVGFQPKALICFGGIAGGAGEWSAGFTDGTTNGCIHQNRDGGAGEHEVGVEAELFHVDTTNASTYQSAVISSFDSDGFTLTWTKAGSPTGIATIKYLAIG